MSSFSHSFLPPLHLICFLSFTFTRLLFANMLSCCLNLFKDQMLAVTGDSTGFCCHRKDGLPNHCAILTLAGKVERCFFFVNPWLSCLQGTLEDCQLIWLKYFWPVVPGLIWDFHLLFPNNNKQHFLYDSWGAVVRVCSNTPCTPLCTGGFSLYLLQNNHRYVSVRILQGKAAVNYIKVFYAVCGASCTRIFVLWLQPSKRWPSPGSITK